MAAGTSKVLLLSPPLRSPCEGDLTLALLQPTLESAGIAADSLHGSLLFPYTDTDIRVRELFSTLYFVSYLYPGVTPQRSADVLLAKYRSDSTLDGAFAPGADGTSRGLPGRELLRGQILRDIELAGVCIERCVERAVRPEYDVVGLSCTFELQLPAAFVLAKRIRERRPDMRLLLGGSACLGPPGDEIARGHPELDAVCHTEGDLVIGALVRSVREARTPAERDGLLSAVPGVTFLDSRGRLCHNAPPRRVDLDRTPFPRYDDFLAQLGESEWSGVCPPTLFFETSRGCWWGQKHPCAFCGLNAWGLSYRRKSPDRAYEEIRRLHERYPAACRLHATDNVLDMGYLRSLMPRLAGLRRSSERPLRLFWEVKSNLRRDQVEALADAGTELVQAGIESLDDEALAMMRKGCTGLEQIQLIKWLYEHGICDASALLVRCPGETAAHYRRMSALVPYVTHLPRPQIRGLELQRFSPYFTEPEKHGIRSIRPKPYYELLYRWPGADVLRLAYCFDFDHDMLEDEELSHERHRFLVLCQRWHAGWRDGMASYQDDGVRLCVYDRRMIFDRDDRIDGVAAEAYRHLDRVRSRDAVRRRMARIHPEVVGCVLDVWDHRRWICSDQRGRVLAVLPRLRHPPTGRTPR